MTLGLVRDDARWSHGFGGGFGDSESMSESHAHGDLELNYVYSGQIEYFLGGKFVTVPERCMAAFWAGVPHQVLSLKEGTTFMWLHVPLATLLGWGLGGDFVQRVLGGAMILDREGLPWDEALTHRWLSDLANKDSVIDATIELEVEARVRRLARGRGQRASAPITDPSRQAQVDAMAAFLASHYREDLTVRDVAQAAGLKPDFATQLFRRQCGLSIWKYLTRLRVSHAQLGLLCTDKTVLAIALESGFGSLARFYAAFRKESGVAPGEYRRVVAGRNDVRSAQAIARTARPDVGQDLEPARRPAAG